VGRVFTSGVRLSLAAVVLGLGLAACNSGSSSSGVAARVLFSVDPVRGPSCENADRIDNISSTQINCVWNCVFYGSAARQVTLTFKQTDGVWALDSDNTEAGTDGATGNACL